MPEGPSILILKEQLGFARGKKILEVSGNAKIDLQKLKGKKIFEIKTWGKQLLFCFNSFFIRIHLLMFGSFRINEAREGMKPRLSIKVKTGAINFYNCSVRLIEQNPDNVYDWDADVLSESWNAKAALKKIKNRKDTFACDVLLDQEVFSGVGNIIKNEVLFRIKVHPLSLIGAMPLKKQKELVKEAKKYSWEFYNWKKQVVLKKHWLIYKKIECPRCKIRTTSTYLGKTNRLTSFCVNCQVVYK
ncbi:MAG: endonuclease [Bacteroidia bacterium]|nr:endonuclease [Bacteroidia bacterium]